MMTMVLSVSRVLNLRKHCYVDPKSGNHQATSIFLRMLSVQLREACPYIPIWLILTETCLKNIRRKQYVCAVSFSLTKNGTSLVSKGLILHGK